MEGPSARAGRMHAIWALSRTSTGTKAIDELFAHREKPIRTAGRPTPGGACPSPISRTRSSPGTSWTPGRGDAAIANSDWRRSRTGKMKRVQMAIIAALGRPALGGTLPSGWVKSCWKPDATLQHAAMQTLRRSDNWPAVFEASRIHQTAAPIRSIALRAASRSGMNRPFVDGLIQRLGSDQDASHRREYADALGAPSFKKPGPWIYWGYRAWAQAGQHGDVGADRSDRGRRSNRSASPIRIANLRLAAPDAHAAREGFRCAWILWVSG